MIDARSLERGLAAPTQTVVTGYLAAIGAAELVTAFVDAELGAALNALLVFALLNHSMVLGPLAPSPPGHLSPGPGHVLVPTLALLPLARLLSLTLPTRAVSPLFWYVLIGVPLLAAVVLIARYIRYRPVDAGIWGWSRHQALVALSGIPLGVVAFVAFHPVPAVESRNALYLIIGTGLLVVFVGLLEEVIFRALLQPNLCARYGVTRGVVVTAALSAACSSGSRSLGAMLFAFGVALYFGWTVYTTRSIMGVALAHGLIGVLTVLVLPSI